MTQNQTDETAQFERPERKRGEKVSVFIADKQVNPKTAKEEFLDATKRFPDEVIDHKDVERMLQSMGLNHGAVSPDMVGDVVGADGRYAVFAGETRENVPTLFTMSESFLFTPLEPGQPVEYPGFTLTWLENNGQVAVKAHKDSPRPVTVSGFLMQDKDKLPLSDARL